MVQPSCVQTASTAEKALSLVRASRNTPAVDSTSAAPPTLASGDPAIVTCTRDAENRPATTASAEAMPPPGDVGDPPPQAENSVASVMPEAAWQAPAQNRRRETAFVSDIGADPREGAVLPGRGCARSRPLTNGRCSLNRQKSGGAARSPTGTVEG